MAIFWVYISDVTNLNFLAFSHIIDYSFVTIVSSPNFHRYCDYFDINDIFWYNDMPDMTACYEIFSELIAFQFDIHGLNIINLH